MAVEGIQELIGRLGEPASESMDLKGSQVIIERSWSYGCYAASEDKRIAGVRYEPCPAHASAPELMTPYHQRVYGEPVRVIDTAGGEPSYVEFACGCFGEWVPAQTAWEYTLRRDRCKVSAHWL